MTHSSRPSLFSSSARRSAAPLALLALLASACNPFAGEDSPAGADAGDGKADGVGPPPLDATLVGRVPVRATVDTTGQLAVSVEVPVLAAGNDLSPTVTLEYASGNDATGPLGLGWSLGTGSVIRRCPVGPPAAPEPRAVTLTAADELCLDGQRLVRVVGAGLEDGSEYRPERDPQTRVRFLRPAGSPGSLRVWRRSGEILEYGSTDMSRLLHRSGEAMAFYLESLVDRRGNVVRYRYERAAGELEPRLARLDYGENVESRATATRSVVFEHAPSARPQVAYQLGERLVRAHRLARVRLLAGAAEGPRLELGYRTRTGGQELLAWVQVCRGADCLPATTFEYTGSPPGFAAEVRTLAATYQGADRQRPLIHQLVDADDDGRDDLVTLGRDEVVVERALPDGRFGSPASRPSALPAAWNPRREAVFASDIDADGYPDLLTTFTDAGPTGLWLLRGSAEGFLPARQVSGDLGRLQPSSLYLVVRDVDHDGYGDVVAFTPAGVRLFAWRGDRFVTLGVDGFVQRAFSTATDPDLARRPREVADVDGDGNLDLVVFGERDVLVSLGRGASFAPPTSWSLELVPADAARPFRSSDHVRLLADMNADGLPDLVGFHTDAVYVALNTGRSFAPAERWLDDLCKGWSEEFHQRTVADIDGDGVLDFVGMKPSTTVVYLGRGGPLPPVAELPGELRLDLPTPGNGRWRKGPHTLTFGDASSDGQNDLIAILPDAVLALENQTGRVRLTGITDGFGHRTRVTYARPGDGGVYARTHRLEFPLVTLPSVGALVRRLEESDGAGGLRALEHRYEDAVMHRLGLGFLGFETRVVTDVALGLETRTRSGMDVERGLAGLPTLEETVRLGGARTPVSRTTTVWESRAILPDAPRVRLLATTHVRSEQLDEAGAVRSAVDTRTRGDERGNVVETVVRVEEPGVEPEVTTTSQRFDAEDEQAWLLGRVTGSEVSFSRGAEPPVVRRASFTYDARGLLRTETREPGSPLEVTVERERGGAFGQVVRQIQRFAPSQGDGITADAITTEYTHGAEGYLASTTNALGQTLSVLRRDDVFGTPVTVADADGRVTESTLDPLGRVREVRQPGDLRTRTTEERCAPGRCPAHAVVKVSVETSGQAPSTTYLDELERPVRTETRGVGGKTVAVVREYTSLGQLARQSAPHFADTPAAEIRWTTTTYDERGRPTRIEGPDGRAEHLEYTATTVTTIDPSGARTTQHLDAQGRTTRVVDAAGARTTTRDPAGRVVRIEAPDGTSIEMAYDALDRRVRLSDPDAGTVVTHFNALGLPSLESDGEGTTRRRYDALGRLLERTRTPRAGAPSIDSYTYDPPNAAGGLASARNANVQRTYAYDALGRLERETRVIGDRTFDTQHRYDALGRLAGTTYPSGLASVLDHDADGHLVAVRDAASGRAHWQLLEAFPGGSARRARQGDGLEIEVEREPGEGQIVAQRASQAGRPLQSLRYRYDPRGLLTERADELAGTIAEYQHDALGRLERTAIGDRAVTTSYGPAGTILAKSDVGAYAYGEACDGVTPGPHAVTSVGAARYCYDRRGRLVSGAGRTLRYGVADVPEAIEQGRARAGFRYGPDDEQVESFVERDGARVSHVLHGAAGYEEATTPDGVELRHHVGATIITLRGSTSDVRYRLVDRLGSLTTVTSERGDTLEAATFDPWGRRTDAGGAPTASAPSSTRFGFTGHEHLDDLGLVHMQGRVYDPVLARFTSPDPHLGGDGTQGLDRYAYVQNGPLSAVDPTGLRGLSLRSVGRSIGRALGGLGRGLSDPGRSLVRAGNRLGSWISKPQNQRLVASIAVAAVATWASMGAYSALYASNAWAAWAAGSTLSAAGGYVSGYIASDGNHAYARRAALQSFAFFQVGSYYQAAYGNTLPAHAVVTKSVCHGVIGGVASAAEGGRFESGFAASAASELIGSSGRYDRAAEAIDVAATNVAYQAASSALVGGTLSELTGGKFEGGAISAAFGSLFNRALHDATTAADKDAPPACHIPMRCAADFEGDGIDQLGPNDRESKEIALMLLGALGGGAKAPEGPSSTVLLRSSRQLQSKYKHAPDFGVEGSYNKANASEFSSAINRHVNAPDVRIIEGTYHKVPVTHYLNPTTRVNVMADPAGNFISGWRLNLPQFQNVMSRGAL